MKLKEIMASILQNEDYKALTEWVDKNQYGNYVLLGEFLNPNNSFDYWEEFKGYFIFKDDSGYEFYARVMYNVTKTPHFEMKMGWVDVQGVNQYLRQHAREVDERRTNTVAKIFRDEVLPYFEEQTLSDILVFKPIDIKRYQFTIRMVKKFTNMEKFDIVENKPYEILIQKK